MSKIRTKKRVSKGEWLEAAMDILAHEGIAGVRVEVLAAKLGTSKSGFYWHFKDRDDFHRQLLEAWEHETTLVITENPEINSGPAARRLESTLRIVSDYELNRLECAIFIWSRWDPQARKAMNRVYNARLGFVRTLFEELGFKGGDLDMRAQLFSVYTTYEYAFLSHLPKSKRSRLMKRCIRLLTQK